MRKAIFLDRDGTLNNNEDQYYIWKTEDFHLNPGVVETLAELQEQGYLLIVISNQGGISKEVCTLDDVEIMNDHMCALLEREGIEIAEVYFCPHHDSEEACLCRKPLPLMIEKAMARYGIDPGDSWFVGDSVRDREAGMSAGVSTVLIESNSDLRQVLDRIV